jgi:LysR family transcriptional activator of nhaA
MTIQRPNFHHLRHFWIVAQEGSLLGASRRLGLRHSTLSAQLRSLEVSLGTSLLLRRPRGVRLTAQGEVVRGYCDQIFRLGGELLEVASQQRAARVRVGMLASVPRSLLYDAIREAFDKPEALRAELLVTTFQSAPAQLVSGRLDVVITDRLASGERSRLVHAHLIGETGIDLYATPTLANRYRSGFPASLDGAPFLMPTTGPLSEGLSSWFAEQEIRPRIVAEFDDVPTMKGFAARGHGVVAIRHALGQEARRRYGLVHLGGVPDLKDRLYALTVGHRVRHPNVQRLIEHCRAKFEA